MNNIKFIVIHHSATLDGKTFDWQAIRNYHINTLGWKDIGYHFGIEKINEQYEILIGRNMLEVGAHTYGINSISLGICLVGNFDTDKVPDQQLSKALELTRTLMKVFNIPIENVIGHREVYVLCQEKLINCDKRVIEENTKTCPGLNFSMNYFRELLAKDENLKIVNQKLYSALSQFDNKFMKEKRIFWS
jgi:N-acetylmuramoyl-L-alanine amidase